MTDQKSSVGFFVAAGVVAVFTLLIVVSNVLPALTADLEPPDKAGRIMGALWAVAFFGLVGFGSAFALYNMGMARRFPDTHSAIGKLNQIHDATRDFEVTDTSQDGFYRNATESGLLNFYDRLRESGDLPKLNALVLEVRRRIDEAGDE